MQTLDYMTLLYNLLTALLSHKYHPLQSGLEDPPPDQTANRSTCGPIPDRSNLMKWATRMRGQKSAETLVFCTYCGQRSRGLQFGNGKKLLLEQCYIMNRNLLDGEALQKLTCCTRVTFV